MGCEAHCLGMMLLSLTALHRTKQLVWLGMLTQIVLASFGSIIKHCVLFREVANMIQCECHSRL